MSGGRLRGFAALAVAGLIVAGCASTSTTSSKVPVANDCSDAAVSCIGLVLEGGSVDDGAFNAAAWAGIQEAARATGASAEYVESADPAAYSDNLTALADRGFDVVVTTEVVDPN